MAVCDVLGNDREKVPVIVPTGEGLETVGFFSHSDGYGLGPRQNPTDPET